MNDAVQLRGWSADPMGSVPTNVEIHCLGGRWCDGESGDGADLRAVLARHREAWIVHESNRRTALLHDLTEEGMGHAIDEARTLHAMGDVLQEMHDLDGAAGK